MELRELMLPAAEAAARIVQGVPAERLAAPTPCPGWDVRTLANHLAFWTGRGETAAAKKPPSGPGEDHDFTAEDGWAAAFAAQARATAAAWTDPAAWEGNTSLTGARPGMPAPVIGGMILGEFVMHGWDLAVATGQDPALPDDVVAGAWEELRPTAAMGREYEAFGDEVPVPESAPLLDRVLGLSGRDPRWTP
ncbi:MULTISPECIES: TIGR03086 family metal-binding protein [Actinomadura]|uniref:TIGR03086 family metal-binding protein n=1 Tax=Actinomadura yumaensis TaxID=111807 RepID=A0ABW2CYP2_9ACTN|nr:TIGR03086 family metal-binding protein [Actinomadura sp. J1-007]MWK39369.1 TIGR03086 family protein [Actinomadura sp. J1-007]